MNKWDRDGDGDFDLADVFRIALPLLGYGLGVVGMIVTATVSWHLLASQQFNPLFETPMGWTWPLVVAGMSEFGMALAWIAMEVGIRKGKLAKRDWSMMVMILIGVVGFVVFAGLIASMQLYDRELLAGKDLGEVAGWGHTIASVLPLFTIVYAIIVNSAYAALERQEKEARQTQGVSHDWQIEKRKQITEQAKQISARALPYGDPVTDPTRHQRAGELIKTKTAQVAGRNGTQPEPPLE